jgi:hypothetical protein
VLVFGIGVTLLLIFQASPFVVRHSTSAWANTACEGTARHLPVLCGKKPGFAWLVGCAGPRKIIGAGRAGIRPHLRDSGPNGGFGVWWLCPPIPALAGNASPLGANLSQITQKGA